LLPANTGDTDTIPIGVKEGNSSATDPGVGCFSGAGVTGCFADNLEDDFLGFLVAALPAPFSCGSRFTLEAEDARGAAAAPPADLADTRLVAGICAAGDDAGLCGRRRGERKVVKNWCNVREATWESTPRAKQEQHRRR